ncbi:helix-turn-helix domain-containing protein [Tabrizicola sp.]|uniref:IclR family transcriptional regulator n=1 Tax=Tabrizicola sp. TaxID=2005166 RepID=UPI001A3AF430|nr:helix-turn-helix domain-containing protein [Tabrizicola sp.]MBL9074274.1 helix-turn-helix domain-containing protein [Tabrizicola sp.]
MGTVGKALDLLDLFTRAEPQLGLSQLARASGLNKATCHRLLTELESRGLLEQVGPAREYRLGPAVLRLSALREAAVPTREAAMPVLRRLAESTGETAHLSHLVAGRLQTLAFAYAARGGVKVMMEDADFLPFHATASGAAVLAFLAAPEPVIAAAPDPAALAARIAATRESGYAETLSTFEKDVHSFAVPLFDATGTCSGALAIAAAAPRMTPALHIAVTRDLTRAGADLTGLWGGQVPEPLARLWKGADP